MSAPSHPRPLHRTRPTSILSLVRWAIGVRFVRVGLAALMLVVVTPGVLEVLEDVGHYLVHGDTLHDEGHGDDHCCSGAFHFCGCHARTHAAPIVVRAAAPATVPPFVVATWSTTVVSGGPHDAHLREIARPPAA